MPVNLCGIRSAVSSGTRVLGRNSLCMRVSAERARTFTGSAHVTAWPFAGDSSSEAMIRVGCSGWQYKHWKGDFYPADLRTGDWFHRYAAIFDTVEINNSFYRLPGPHLFRSWRERAPAGFLFAVKASRYLTHMKKLKDPEEPLQRFFETAAPLGRRLGPVLYQLPPRWGLDIDRLRAFVTALPRRVRHVLEFREPGWYTQEVF